MLLSLWSGFWNWAGGEQPEETGGGAGGDIRRYREKLRAINRAADRRLLRNVQEARQEIADLAPTELKKEIAPALQAIEARQDVDWQAVSLALSGKYQGVLTQMQRLLTRLQAMEEEMAAEEEALLMACLAV